ncbi:MAG TPA: tetratricopeptide repeat protein [Terracidiphilus sp.]|nr:tetratricopeptide repeat protein [Terracidiphilus sp.]
MRRYLAAIALLCGTLRAETVLVLPFFNHSETSLDWIGESISESLHDTLAAEGMLVLDRDDRLEAYRRLAVRPGAELTHASVIKIGQALDASLVIYGYYDLGSSDPNSAPATKSLRVNARILDLKHLRQFPEFTEVRALEDLTALQAHLGWRALQYLTPKSVPPEDEFMRERPRVRLDAVESYVRGLLAQTPDQRQRFFAQAARLDEHYSQPAFQLGMTYWANKDYQAAATWLARVDRSNPHYLESQFFLGLCWYYSGDFAGAEHAFQSVSASVPLNEVFNDLGAAQNRHNNTQAAITSFQKALDGDSADPDYHFNLGYVYWKLGNFEEAVKRLRSAVERNPSDTEATALLGRALKRDGPRPGDPKSEGRERLKTNYDEAAYRQLQAELQSRQ